MLINRNTILQVFSLNIYISNITNTKSPIINQKNHINTHLILVFLMLLTEKSLEIFSKHRGCFFISECFALN